MASRRAVRWKAGPASKATAVAQASCLSLSRSRPGVVLLARDEAESYSETRKQVDLNLDSTFHHPLSLSTDATISCQYIPAHLGRTAASPGSLYRHRADEKIAKHAAGCARRLRALLPFVADIGGGIGDDPFWHWLISVYHAYERRLRANGGDGSEAAYALENLLRELQVVLVRDNYTAIMRLVEDR